MPPIIGPNIKPNPLNTSKTATTDDILSGNKKPTIAYDNPYLV